MRLKDQKPSKNVTQVQYPTRGRGDRQDSAYSNPDGKTSNDRIYKTPEFRRAIEDVSSEFQSRTRTDGKRSKEPDRAGADKYMAENWLNRSKDKISTIKPKMKPNR